jgi:hypothetical protein
MQFQFAPTNGQTLKHKQRNQTQYQEEGSSSDGTLQLPERQAVMMFAM